MGEGFFSEKSDKSKLKTEELIDRNTNAPFLRMISIFAIILSVWFIFTQNYLALFFGLFGCAVNFIVDYIIWYKIKHTRVLKGDINPISFFLMFMVYGIFQFSFAIIIFQSNIMTTITYSLAIFIGLSVIGFISNYWEKDIHVSRKISDTHWIFRISFVIISYLIIYFIYDNFMLIVYLFGIGILINFSLEIPLLITKTRTFHFKQFILGTFFEFNMGIPILYLLYNYFL